MIGRTRSRAENGCASVIDSGSTDQRPEKHARVKAAILAWARRMADHDKVQYVDLVIQSDGYVYAMPADHDRGAVAWWPLPYLGPGGEEALASGEWG